MIATMSPAAVAQKGFADFGRGDIRAVLDACADNISWGAWNNPVVPFSKTYQGKEGVAEFFQTLGSTISYSRFEPYAFFESGNRVFCKVVQEATVKYTGKKFGHDALMEFVINEEGKISSFYAYVDSADQSRAFIMD